MKIVRKIRANFHSLEEILMFIHLFFLVTILPLLIRLLTIPQLMKILTPQHGEVKNARNLHDRRDTVVKYADYILSLNFWMYKNTCLKRSLVLYYFFRKLGMDVYICFGVKHKKDLTERETGKRLEGHAWLSHNGDFFLEKNPEETKTYAVTYCFPVRNG